MKYKRIVEAVFAEYWAIQPEKMRAIVEFLSIKAAGDDIEFSAAARAEGTRSGGVAIIPVRGTIVQRANMLSEISGATSTEQIGGAVRAAVNDPDISSIILDIDSPGGSVYGVQELADEIYSLRGQKPIVAAANPLAASAAYWIASAADEITVTPSGEVGSVGVLAMHVDQSELNEKAGIKPTFVFAGDNKVEGNPHQPLSDDSLAFMQSRVNDYYQAFVGAVARNRGVSVDVVEDSFGQGRTFGAGQSQSVRMVDKIETLAETINRYRPRIRNASLRRAAYDFI